MHPWLAALRHDLVKRLIWPARDLLASGAVAPELLRAAWAGTIDDEGAPIDPLALWARFRSSFPRAAPEGGLSREAARALDAFEERLLAARTALGEPWPAPRDALLGLDLGFAALAEAVQRSTQEG